MSRKYKPGTTKEIKMAQLLSDDGHSYNKIGRILGRDPQSIINWLKGYPRPEWRYWEKKFARNLQAQGYTFENIVNIIGVDRSTLYRWGIKKKIEG